MRPQDTICTCMFCSDGLEKSLPNVCLASSMIIVMPYGEVISSGSRLQITATANAECMPVNGKGVSTTAKMYEEVIAFLVFVSVFVIMLTLVYSMIIEFHALYCNLVVWKHR